MPPVMSQMRILKFISFQSHIQNVGTCACVIHGVALLTGQGIDTILGYLVAMLGAPERGECSMSYLPQHGQKR